MAINKCSFVVVNKDAYILSGQCKDISGKVISFDATTNDVILKVDEETSIITKKKNILQADSYKDLPCKIKDCSVCGECEDLS